MKFERIIKPVGYIWLLLVIVGCVWYLRNSPDPFSLGDIFPVLLGGFGIYAIGGIALALVVTILSWLAELLGVAESEKKPIGPSVFQPDAELTAKQNFESPIEEMFWNEWQRQGGKSRIDLTYQYKVPDTRFRIDFAHLPKMIAIELDGHEFHSSKEQFTRDRRRQRSLEGQGWRVIRFSGSEIVSDVESCFLETLDFIENIE